MPRDLISKRTRREFREWLVGWTLRTITELFEDHGLNRVPLPPESLPPGQRRGLVEEYYARVHWDDPAHVRKVLDAYEEILDEGTSADPDAIKRLVRLLERDGYVVDGSEIRSSRAGATVAELLAATDRVDLDHLESYIQRIRRSVEDDPELAIGSTKELLEATLKTILDELAVQYPNSGSLPKLLKKAQRELRLAPADVPDEKKGQKTIKRVLSSIGAVVIGVAELRNLYGSGHGASEKRSGIQKRHADLVVSIGTAACTFLLQTFEEQQRATNSP